MTRWEIPMGEHKKAIYKRLETLAPLSPLCPTAYALTGDALTSNQWKSLQLMLADESALTPHQRRIPYVDT